MNKTATESKKWQWLLSLTPFQLTIWFQNTAMISTILRPWSPPLEPVLSDTSVQTPGQGSLCIHLPRLQRTPKAGRWASHKESPSVPCSRCMHTQLHAYMELLNRKRGFGSLHHRYRRGNEVWRQHSGSGRLCESPNTKVQYYVLVWHTVDSNGLSAPCSLHSNLIEKSPHPKHSLPQRRRALPTSFRLSVWFSFPAGWWN